MNYLKGVCIVLLAISVSGCITTAYAIYQAANNPLTLSQQIKDKSIHAKAVIILNGYPGLTHTKNIHLLVFNRQLLIVGEVPSQQIRRGLVKQLSQVPGVSKIFNRLNMGHGYSEENARSDFLLDIKIKASFRHFEELNRHHYPFIVYQHKVYILGVGTSRNTMQVSQLVSKVKGVKQVVTFFELA